jgi:hypothetical protein
VKSGNDAANRSWRFLWPRSHRSTAPRTPVSTTSARTARKVGAGTRCCCRYETKFTIDLCGAPLPRALRLECDQPILGVEWYTTSDFGAEWNEDLARAGDSLRATTARRVSDRDVSDAVRFQLVVLADKVVNIEKLRVVTPPAAPQSPTPKP